MAEPFLGEVRLFGFNFAPVQWAQCNGQLLPIEQNAALFELIGTTYGGDGQTTFALPDLRGRTAVHPGAASGIVQGALGGTEDVTLTLGQMPAHFHGLVGGAGKRDAAATNGGFLVPGDMYGPSNPDDRGALAATAVAPVGGSQPHENMQPYLVLNYCISLFGVFPSQG